MADDILDPEIIRKLNAGLELTAEEQAKLAASAGGAAKALNTMTSNLKALGKEVGALGAKMYKGEQGASVFNDAITKSTDALGDFIAMIPIVGKIMGGLVKGVGKYTAEVNQMSDRLYKSYQTLSQSGLTAGDGMMGLADAAQRLGYGLDQVGLDEFARLMTGASKDLALMAGSAVQGRKRFTEFSSAIVRSEAGERFQDLGMSVEDINDGIARFIADQTRLGRAAGRTNQDLEESAKNYILEMDKLARLTGEDAKSLQARREADAREERFRAALLKVEREQGPEAARLLRDNIAAVGKTAPEVAAGLKDMAGGFINTEAAQKLFRAGITRLPQEMTQRLGGGFDQLGAAAQRTTRTFGESLGAVGAFNKTFPDLAQMVELGQLSLHDYNQIVAEISRDQAAGGDRAVKEGTRLRRDQMDVRDALQDLVKAGINPVTNAMSGLATITGQVVRGLGGTVPGGGMGGAEGAGGGFLGGIKRFFSGLGGGLGQAGAAAPPAGGAIAQQDLAAMGLKIKQGDVQAQGSVVQSRTLELAKAVQASLPGFRHFTGFNDRFHQENAPASAHTQGSAFDFTLQRPPTREEAAKIVRDLYAMGAVKVIDEYNNPSRHSTGGHFHVQAMAKGGITQGPSVAGEAGPEAVVPLPDGKQIPVRLLGLGTESDYRMGPISTDTKLMGSQFASAMAGVAAREDITARVANLVEEGIPLQGALQQTLKEFQGALQELIKGQGGATEGEGMMKLMYDLVELQKQQNATSRQMLQAATN
jgi:hypothetical protein